MLPPDATVVTGSYGFQLTPWGGIGSVAANTLSVPVVNLPNVTFQVTGAADSSAPSTPGGLAAQVLGSSAAALTWSPPTDNVGVAGYKILVDNAYLYYSSTPSFTVTGLSPSTSHTFSVQAFDRQNNLSPAATANGSTTARTDAAAPTPPGPVTATATDRTVSLSWPASSDNVGVIGYLVGPSSAWVPAGATSVTLSALSTNTTYNLDVQALDGSGNTSDSPITVTTAAAGTVAPTQPASLYSPSATVSGGIQVSWGASTDPAGVAGYYVYRNNRRWATVTNPTYTDPASATSTTSRPTTPPATCRRRHRWSRRSHPAPAPPTPPRPPGPR